MKAEILNIETLVTDSTGQLFYIVTLQFDNKPPFAFNKEVNITQNE